MAKKKPIPEPTPEPKKDPEGPMAFKPKELSPKAPKYRFYCNACTGIAFYSLDKKPGDSPVKCDSCGKVIDTFPEANYIQV